MDVDVSLTVHDCGIGILLAGKAVGIALAIVTVIALSYLGYYMVKHMDAVGRRRIALAFILMAGSVVFWTLFEQAGSSLALFAESNTNLSIQSSPAVYTLFGHDLFVGSKQMLEAAGPAAKAMWWIDTGIDAPQTQSFNPGFIIMLAPIFAAMWAWLGRRKADPPTMAKFGLALLQVGGGFLLLVLGAQYVDARFRVPLYGRPADLVEVALGSPGLPPDYRFARQAAAGYEPYADRAAIAAGHLEGRLFLFHAQAEPVHAVAADLVVARVVVQLEILERRNVHDSAHRANHVGRGRLGRRLEVVVLLRHRA